MRTTKILLFSIFYFVALSLHAQTNFQKGYYIATTQDTIRGYIDYRSERRNYRLCVFKESLNSEAVRLYPQDIMGFGIENQDFYVKRSFISRKGEEIDGFFKVIIRGKLSLLRYQSRYFAENENKDLFEISQRKEVSGRKIRDDYHGLGTLKILLKDCSEISESYLEKEYKLTAHFADIFKKYNSCIGTSVFESKKVKIRPHADFGITITPAVTNLDLSSSISQVQFENELSLSVGGFVSIFLPKVDENVRLLIEANYGRYSQYSYFSSSSINNDVFVDYTYLKVPVYFRYSFNRLFFDVGIQNQFILNQEIKWRIETMLQNTVYTSEGGVPPFDSWANGYLLGVGTKHMVSGFIIRPSFRFSQFRTQSHLSKPVFQTFELSLSIQLTN